ncbi:hypothetical protein Tco_1311687 [Tanacetum coccineum]
MVLAPGQPIPHGRSYRYHLNGSVHMMTMRKRVGQLPTHRLVVRHSVDYSSSDNFSSDDFLRDSSSSSSSESSSDSFADALSDSTCSCSSSDHSSPTPSSERPSHDSSSVSPSCKRSRSYAASIPLSSPTLGWGGVMAISVISVSSDSSEESVGTSTGRVILFGTIPTTIPDTTLSVIPPTTHIDTTPIPIVSPTIPPSPDYTPASPDYSPASDTEFDPSEDPSSDHIPPLPATLPFLSSTAMFLYSDIPDTPPSFTHGTPFTKTTLSTQSTPIASGALRRQVISCTGATYSSWSTVPLPILKTVIHETRGRWSPESATDLEGCSKDSFKPYVPKETGLGVDFVDESSKPSRFRGTDLEMDVDVVKRNRIDIDPKIQAENDECFAYADALRDRGVDARVVVEGYLIRKETALRIRGGLNEQIDRQMAGALGARNGNGGNGNGGNRNSNRNGGGNGYNFRGLMPARECTFKAFLKCHPLSFNGTEGVVRTYEVDDRSVLSKKRGPEDGDRVVELGCERK